MSFWLCLLCLLFDVRLSPLINITYICTHLQSHVMTAACCWCTPRGIQYSRCDSTEELWALVGCLNISRTHAGNFSLCSSCAGNNNKQNVSEWQVITVHPIIFVMLSALNSTQRACNGRRCKHLNVRIYLTSLSSSVYSPVNTHYKKNICQWQVARKTQEFN